METHWTLKEDLNSGSTGMRAIEWEASKVFVGRGKEYGRHQKEKKNTGQNQGLGITNQKIWNWCFSGKLYQDLCKLKFQLQEIKKGYNILYSGSRQVYAKMARKQTSYIVGNWNNRTPSNQAGKFPCVI